MASMGSSVSTNYVSAEQIEDIVRQLKDVLSVRVAVSQDGQIEELHVLANARRAPKQVARDVELAVMAQLGVKLDYKKISIAQAQPKARGNGNGGTGNGIAALSPRFRLCDVAMSIQKNRAEATVSLKREDQVNVGLASGHASSGNQLRLVASATLRAIENTGSEDGDLFLEELDASITLANRPLVVVLVSTISERGEEYLTGSAMICHDLTKAVANATMSAVNRRVSTVSMFEEELS